MHSGLRNRWRSIFLLLLICRVSPLAGKPSIDTVVNRDYNTRRQLFDRVLVPYLHQLDVTAQLRQLDDWQQVAKAKNDRAVLLDLVLERYILLEEQGMLPTDERISRLNTLLSEIDRRRFPQYAALVMNDLGNNYFGKKHNYGLAFEHFINCYNLTRTIPSDRFSEKRAILVNIGNRYYKLGDFARSMNILLEADSIPAYGDHLTLYNNKNTIGLIHRARGQYSEALRFFSTALGLARRNGDSTWAAIVTGNIGICYYQQGRLRDAIPLLKEDIARSLSDNDAVDNGMNSLLILADIYQRLGDMDQLGACLEAAHRYLDQCRDRLKPLSMLYPLLAKYYFSKGEVRQAYFAQDSAMIFKDSITARDNIYKLAKIEHLKDLEMHAQQVQRLTTEKKLAAYARNALIAGIVLLGIIGVLIINRQKLKFSARNKLLSAERELAEQELKTASRQLAIYTSHLQEKNDLIEKAGIEIEKLQQMIRNSETAIMNNDVLQQLYSATILTDEEWIRFKRLFSQAHPGFLERIEHKLPDLTPADTRFIVLSKLNLSNKEMAGILGVQADTIRSYKHRLRKRFDLPETEDLKEWIARI